MQSDITRNVKLRDIIYMYSEESKQTSAEFLRLWRMAFRGFTQMGLMAFWEPRTVEIAVNANLTATLPTDYIQWVKVGQFNRNGELQTLMINEDLTTFKDVHPSRVSLIQPEITASSGALLSDYWFDGNGLYFNDSGGVVPFRGFGLGSHLLQPGQCRFDMDNNCIVLGQDYQWPHVVLEYISAPEKNDDYSIPIQFQEAMIAWLAWRDIINIPSSNRSNRGMVQSAALQFKSQLALAKKMYRPFHLQQAEQYFREAQKLAIKG